MPDQIQFQIYPLQTEVQKRLQAHSYLSDIPILTEEKGDIENEIKRSMGELEGVEVNGKIGACIVVLTPTAKSNFPNAPGPLLDGLALVLSVVENVTLNQGDLGTKKHALEIVEFCLRYLHHWTVPGTNASLCVQPKPFEIVKSDPLIYQAFFTTKLALKPEP